MNISSYSQVSSYENYLLLPKKYILREYTLNENEALSFRRILQNRLCSIRDSLPVELRDLSEVDETRMFLDFWQVALCLLLWNDPLEAQSAAEDAGTPAIPAGK